jgi:hypothetical protein
MEINMNNAISENMHPLFYIPLGMYRSVEKQATYSLLHSVGMHPIIPSK